MILISTGALLGRPNGRDFRLLEALTPYLHCDGYELMIYQSWYDQLDDLLAFLDKAKLNIPVLHCEKDIGTRLGLGGEELTAQAFSDFVINCQIACAAGAERLVLHLWSGQVSDQHMENNLSAFAALEEAARQHGLLLTIENVVCNQQNPMTHLNALRNRYRSARFTFDTKMAAFHSQLEALYQPENAWLMRHIRHFHVNDYAGGYMEWDKLLGRVLPMGKGHIDFDRFFAFVKESGYTGDFTIEATAFDSDGVVDTQMLNGQVERLRAVLG